MQYSTISGRRSRVALGIGAGAIAIALTLTGCSGSGTTPGSTSGSSSGSSGGGSAAAKDFSIAFVPKNLNNPYTDVELSGGTAAATAVGATSSIVGPNDASASSQVSYINTLTQKRVKVIAIAANDPNAVCSALNQAKAAGAKIITFDSDANCRTVFINQVNSKDVALVELKQLHEQLPNGGEIAILSATANATNQNTWIKFMKEELASNADYKNLKLVTTVYGDDDDTKSFQAAQGLLKSYPNLKGIISPTTVGIAAAARYLSKSSYKGKVVLVGLGLPKQMRAYIKDGTVKEFALWDPAQIGKAAVYAGKALVAGTITGKEGDSFEAGDLGMLKVQAAGLVVVGPPTEFNADNIDKFHFDDKF